MYTSKLKLVFHWLLIVVAFYIFWLAAYLIMVKFAISEVDSLKYNSGSIWTQITASDIFWFAMFIFGMAVVIFGIKKAMQYAPNPKIAALIYALLIVISVGVLVNRLLETSTLVDVLPHFMINGVLLVPIVLRIFKKDDLYVGHTED